MKKMPLQFEEHYLETAPRIIQNMKNSKLKNEDQKVNLWNAFMDSNLSEITEADCAIYPRVLPASYLPTIQKTAKQITEFVMRLVSLPEKEVLAIVPAGPIRDFLIKELKVLKYRPDRYIGSFRFDMAIVGEPHPLNPPQLLEINEIGFDGLSRMPFIQETLFSIVPKMKKQFFALDTTAAELKNMRRLGQSLARFQTDCYNWDEECLLRRSREAKYDLKLITPEQYGFEVDKKDFPELISAPIKIKNGKLKVGKNWSPESFMVSFALELEDYLAAEKFYRELVRQKANHYGPFLMGLVASKNILVLLHDPILRRKLLGSSDELSAAILPASFLSDAYTRAKVRPEEFVLKHVDGFGGEQVFLGKELLENLKKIPKSRRHEWILQQRTKLNVLEIDGILSKPKRTIGDLGVFIQYDWSHGKFNHFEVGGFLTRATNTSFKVNVSAGGAQVAVMFDRNQ